MLKFQNPCPTKSGKSVVKVWGDLKENWRLYKRAKLEDDFEQMRVLAAKIKNIQEDLGIKQAEFPELQEKETKIESILVFFQKLFCFSLSLFYC